MVSLHFMPNQAQLDCLSLASPFASQIYQKHSDDAQAFLGEYGFERSLSSLDFDALVRRFVGLGKTNYLDFTNEEMVMSGLRKLRQMLMLKWIWQDALSVISLEELTHELSDFADSCIQFSKDFVYHKLTKRYGEPMIRQKIKHSKMNLPSSLWGKWAHKELNLSSDIDLIFVHINNGETNGKKSLIIINSCVILGVA